MHNQNDNITAQIDNFENLVDNIAASKKAETPINNSMKEVELVVYKNLSDINTLLIAELHKKVKEFKTPGKFKLRLIISKNVKASKEAIREFKRLLDCSFDGKYDLTIMNN